MQTFVMLSRLAPDVLTSPQSFEQLERAAMERIRKECPDVIWKHNYATVGPWDYIDIFEAPDIEAATRLSALIRSFGHAQTEIWGAVDWGRFKEIVHSLPSGKAAA